MSSPEEESIGRDVIQTERPKKRPRACDACRRKKVRCNGPENPGGECTSCINGKVNCTYVEESKRRVPTKKYVASLEDRITDLDQILRKLCPDEKIYSQWLRSLVEADDENLISPSHLTQETSASSEVEMIEGITNAIRLVNDDLALPHDEIDHLSVVNSGLDTDRFFGKSSSEMLIREAVSMKKTLVGGEERPIFHKRREEFWTLRPWERKFQNVMPQQYTFPEADLARDLVDLFFEHCNLHLPLLHRPSFERSVRDCLHYSNDGFAGVYLLVCAVGSRFSSDPRVLLDGVQSYHSAGWKWFKQVETGKTSFLSLPSLYDLQLYCLTVVFLHSSSTPQAVWTMTGIAIRLAQDIGVHRRRSRTPSAEDELWKRAFWVLICIDRVNTVAVGRSVAIQDEDYDLDFPIDCDDEYWEHPDPKKRFKQPPNKPSSMTAFILKLKLMHIMNCCIRGVYSISKINEWCGLVGNKWKERIVMELDSSLNKWLASVPEYLAWDPHRENLQLFNLSASMHAAYHHLKILIHRPSAPNKPSSFPFPSLPICTNSARACVRIASAFRSRNVVGPPPTVQLATFTSAIMLLLNIWLGKKSDTSSEQDADDMMDVLKCLNTLKASEDRWCHAGRYWDVLAELSAMGECPLPSKDGQPDVDIVPTMTSIKTIHPLEAKIISFPHAPTQFYDLSPDSDETCPSLTDDEEASPVPVSQTITPHTSMLLQGSIVSVRPSFSPCNTAPSALDLDGNCDSTSAGSITDLVDFSKSDEPYIEGLEQEQSASAYSYDDEMWSNAPIGFGYIASLEDRISGLDTILRQLCPKDATYDDWISSLHQDRLDASASATPEPPSRLNTNFIPPSIFGAKPAENLAKVIRATQNHISHPPDEESGVLRNCPTSSLDTSRFFGKSSNEMLVYTALSMKREFIGLEEHGRPILRDRREEFWTLRPWERGSERVAPPRYVFPEPDLAKELVDLFFIHSNLYLPLLHRPTFQRSIHDGLHYTDDGFGAVYLLVCAVGSRFSNDPRVLLDGFESYHSAGWKWFTQVETGKTSFISLPSLYDLQLYCLTVIFLQSSSAPQPVWTLVGIALRLAQDIGVHRRKSSVPTVEDELWKRAFWVLISIDRLISTALGRPLSVQEEDCDLDLPIDCDDEYWEHPDPTQRFKQPLNKPSSITSFILQLKLNKILGICIRMIYSLNKMNMRLGFVGQQWKAHIVAELDSGLNKWLQSVPEHLRWDSDDVKSDEFFNQSMALHAMWHYTQILIHRPFIPSPNKPSTLAFPSLAICTNSARSCIHLAYTQLERNKTGPPPPVQMAAFASAVVLLIGIWGAQASGLPPNKNPDMNRVQKVLEILKAAEERWHIAGRFWDALSELSSPDHPERRRQSQIGLSGFQILQVSQESAEPASMSLPQPPLPHVYRQEVDQQGNGHSSQTAQNGWISHDQAAPPADSFGGFVGQHLPYQYQVNPPNTSPQGSSTWANTSNFASFAHPPPQPEQPNGTHPDQEMGDRDLTGSVVAMWSNAPASFGLDEWDRYFLNLG
ncbi:unnamed protein product [Cyclocybe aegerita]|uniref:Zn(2)-C6 fungal-type domain-containing protein n=1 Tax=Cyclocybe aegerita TaxID=1973307 RepID=A0A8S0WBL6_CYCAE|nr:unnamed protein product [Cyclocybe aegerita]